MRTSNQLLLAFAAIVVAIPFVLAFGAKAGVRSAVELSGVRAERTLEALPFKHLDVRGPITLILTAGLPEVRLEGDQALLDLIDDEAAGDKLTLDLDSATGVAPADKLTAYVRTPELDKLELRGQASARGPEALPYRRLHIEGAGGPNVDLAFTDAAALRVEYSGGGYAKLAGRVADLDIDLAGGSTVEARDLAAHVARVDASGGHTLDLRVDSLLDVSGAGSLKIRYVGSPKVSSRGSGNVSVEQVD